MKGLPENIELLTDLYELTMAASYYDNGMADPATFSLFIRKYPPGRSYFVAAGLEDVQEYVTNFHFSKSDLAYLDSTGLFSKQFLDYLERLRFTGNVRAIEEGEIFFKNEPILEVTAPIIEAQILETLLVNTVNLQSIIATKAARCVSAASGRGLVDFSLRRTHGIDAGLKVARNSYLAGFVGTSNVLAGKLYGIPISGTMAHSYISSFKEELEAFRAFARSFPKNAVLLIDTYDTLKGARNAAIIGKEMAASGDKLSGVRLDSGDMVSLSREVRKILDEEGLHDSKIFASGNFDEYKIEKTIKEGAKIDAFGVGTKMGVSADAPYLDVVYKLVQYSGRPIMKWSTGKSNLPGEKQVFRKTDGKGRFKEDILGLKDESFGETKSLMGDVIRNGKSLRSHPSLQTVRDRFRENFSLLDERYKSLQDPPIYPVKISNRLQELYEGLC
ncbi:MAG: nicotinate phosphoribosyltransferase [Deltaproteobacteria bacterium]|nr:nicotinate phosphoribosyltransferase [Deltaproteobacteria bacterium]